MKAILNHIRSSLEALQTREGVAQAVNSALVLLNWQVGHRIRTEILTEQRAGYGEEIVPTLSRQLTLEFGPSDQTRWINDEGSDNSTETSAVR
jgi:hypothetical protein